MPIYVQFFYTGTHKHIHIFTIQHKHKNVNVRCIFNNPTAAEHMQ